MTPRRFQVLSLDGGGFKGMFSAAVLACLEADLGISITDHFDLVTGTSTGGMIALGLGAGLRPSELVDFYVEQGPKIFPRRRTRAVRRIARSKYRSRPLQRALHEVFGDTTLADCTMPVAIPSYDLCNDDVYVFRTPHAPELRRDRRERLVDVALATSAAPTYLPAHHLRGLRLVDGGMWANNPTIVGITEAVKTFGCDLADIHVLSLGTTSDTSHRHRRLDRGGLVSWAADGLSIVLRGQAIGANNAAGLLLGKDHILRIDPQVPANELVLDGVAPDQLRGRAEYTSRHISHRFNTQFASHQPPAYTPHP